MILNDGSDRIKEMDMLILYSFLLLALGTILLVLFIQRLNQVSPRLIDLTSSLLQLPLFLLSLIVAPLILIGLDKLQIPYLPWAIIIFLSAWFFVNLLKLYNLQSPFQLLELFYRKCLASFTKGDANNEWMESVLDLGLKSIDKRETSFSHAVIQKYEALAIQLLQEKNKFISNDLFNYQFIQILNQLELLFQKAKKDSQTLLLTDIMQVYSKLSLEALKKEPSLAPVIVHFIHKDFEDALDNGFYNVLETTSASLREIFKRYAEIPNLKNIDLKISGIRTISILEEIAKALFKRDKSTPIPFLNRPFLEIRDQLNLEPLKSHPDSEVLLKQVNQIITEFLTLETVLRTMPSMPSLVPEEKSSAPS